jgi:hypothetical protein
MTSSGGDDSERADDFAVLHGAEGAEDSFVDVVADEANSSIRQAEVAAADVVTAWFFEEPVVGSAASISAPVAARGERCGCTADCPAVLAEVAGSLHVKSLQLADHHCV